MTRETPYAPNEAVLTLRGEIDFFTEDAFRHEAERLLADDGVERFVVDLGNVALIDSSGLGLLVDLLRLCRELGLPMTLRNVPPRLQRLLHTTGLDLLFAGDSAPSDPGSAR